ncbi:ABC transporter ATP-binding protein [bacterium]|nr:ABC transporter ATP-binding protein [bacterium]
MQQRTFIQTLNRLLAYLNPYGLIIFAAIVCTVSVSLAKLSQSWFIGQIFGVMSKGTHLSSQSPEDLLKTEDGQKAALLLLNQTCLGFLAMMVLLGLATYVMRYLVNLGGQKAMKDMRNQVFAHVQRLPMSFYDKMRMGEIQSRASGDVMAATGLFTQLADFLVNFMIVVFAMTFMIVQDWKMTLMVLGLSPFIAVAIGEFGKRIGRLTETIQARGADLSAITYEGISSVKGIKAYGLEDLQVRRFEDKSNESYRVSMKLVSISASQSPIVEFLGALGIVAIVWLGAYRIVQGQVTIGQMSQYWTLLVMTTQPINALSGFYSSFQAAAAAAERVFFLLDQPTEEQLTAHLPDLPPIQGQVDFDQVVFGYSEEKQALKGLNLSVKVGEVVAIVGSNGAGKTTLINLLARFYDPQSGTVSIDGHDLQKFNVASLRRQIGVVTQESILLAGSISDNIGMGREGASHAEIEAAAELANAHEFVSRLPEGYATDIGERGSRLSGGQRQRIAIARALLRNPRILVLDEFTSGIDPESEISISEAIENSLQGRTCFVIAHRFNTIRNAHRIIVLDEGGIVEAGNHDQLMANDGLYRRIYQAQIKPKESEVLVQAS